MVCLGLVLGIVGIDVNSGSARLTFGSTDLYDGIEFVVIAVGLFGIAEIATNLESTELRGILQSKIGRLWPTRDDFGKAGGQCSEARRSARYSASFLAAAQH